MDELIKLVSQKVGIPEQQAKLAIETVLTFIETKLPATIANQVRQALQGGMLNEQTLKQAGNLLGGLLNKK